MIGKILLISSFLVFMAIAVEAKIRSRLGMFIVFTGIFIGILNVLYVLIQLIK